MKAAKVLAVNENVRVNAIVLYYFVIIYYEKSRMLCLYSLVYGAKERPIQRNLTVLGDYNIMFSLCAFL